MRVSTAALYTLAALVAHDLTSQAIAAPAEPPTSPDQPSTITPAEKGLTTSELVAPIAPAEAFPIELAPVATIPVAEKAAPLPEIAAPAELAKAPENPPAANLVPAAVPLNIQSAPAANSAPVFQAVPEVTAAVERTSTPPSAPLMQTLNEEALSPETTQAANSRLSAQPTVAVEALTLEEIKAFQQGLATDRAKTATVANSHSAETETTTAKPAALVSANLAEAATAAFGNQTNQMNPTVANPAAISQPTSTVNSSGHDDNNGFSLSVQNPSNNARSYYNLTTRPPSQLSNGNVSLLFPLSLPSAITSAFGWRVHPVLGSARFHAGTDLGAPQGTPVLAALDGKVEIADFVGGYGLTIVLQHTKGTEQTLYAHLSEIFVQPGDTIKQGEAIGRVGSTGLSTGPHLHFEFRKLTQEGWTVMDPGPALEYALLHFNPSQQVAQASSASKLPNFFKYSGKFLDILPIAAQDTKTQEDENVVASGQTQPSISQSLLPQSLITTIPQSLAEARTNFSPIQLPRPQ